jgi:hypothetical protein
VLDVDENGSLSYDEISLGLSKLRVRPQIRYSTQLHRKTERQTEGQTDRQTDREERVCASERAREREIRRQTDRQRRERVRERASARERDSVFGALFYERYRALSQT